MGVKYIHLNYVLRFIREREKTEFQVVNSEDFGIKGDMSFKAIIPKSFEVKTMQLGDEGFLYDIKISDSSNKNALDGPNILLWNSELYSTKNESNVCLSDMDINDGVLIFENFFNIPEMVDVEEIIAYM